MSAQQDPTTRPAQTAAADRASGAVWDRALAAEFDGLRAWARRLSGEPEEADDLVQETMERALRYRHAHDDASPLGPWLRRIALRAFFDRRARAAREPVRLGDAAEAVPERRPDGGEARAELAKLLAPLSEPERETLVGFHARGETLDELAARLGLPVGTIKSHLHRARRKLGERWRKQ